MTPQQPANNWLATAAGRTFLTTTTPVAPGVTRRGVFNLYDQTPEGRAAFAIAQSERDARRKKFRTTAAVLGATFVAGGVAATALAGPASASVASGGGAGFSVSGGGVASAGVSATSATAIETGTLISGGGIGGAVKGATGVAALIKQAGGSVMKVLFGSAPGGPTDDLSMTQPFDPGADEGYINIPQFFGNSENASSPWFKNPFVLFGGILALVFGGMLLLRR
jgi:hypothetical protein